jgi:Antitoxin MazE-like
MPKRKKPSSTVERWLRKPGFRKAFKKEYEKFLLSELVLALMAEDGKSVRKLAGELGVSKTVIQNLRSGEQTDMQTTNHGKEPGRKMRAYHSRLRAAGLRPLQIWVPDIRAPRLSKEARRQSLLASRKSSEQEALAFIDEAADLGDSP